MPSFLRHEVSFKGPSAEGWALSPEEARVRDDFMRLFHHKRSSAARMTGYCLYKGRLSRQNPCDLMILHELIEETRPEVVVEVGCYFGGATSFLADQRGVALVVGVDIKAKESFPEAENIRLIKGDSALEETFSRAAQLVAGRPAMVILDSDHAKAHLLKELALWPRLVTKGQYLLVSDTDLPVVRSDFGPSPAEALAEWLPNNTQFKIDESRERFMLTSSPGGWLRHAA